MSREPQPQHAVDEDTLVLSGITNGAYFAERYRIEALLGTGAMGKVFRAVDLRADREVALKVLHPDKARKEQVLARFRREAEILAGLGHPGIVRVLDSGRAGDGIDYLVMELLEGRTLRDHLHEREPLTAKELLGVLVPVADALSAAHAKGIVHRDLKPDNVFLLAGGGVKVLDFGLSMLDTDKRMTKTGVMLGTPRYMAPEQIRSAKDVDPRVDVYALGVVAHEALTKASPFPAGDAGQLLGCIMEGRIHRLEELRPDLPAGVGDVVRRAMARDRRERFATIGAFAESFARTIGVAVARARQPGALDESSAEHPFPDGEVSIPATPDKPRFTVPDASPAPAVAGAPRSRRGIWIAVFALAVLGVACVSAALALGLREVVSSVLG